MPISRIMLMLNMAFEQTNSRSFMAGSGRETGSVSYRRAVSMRMPLTITFRDIVQCPRCSSVCLLHSEARRTLHRLLHYIGHHGVEEYSTSSNHPAPHSRRRVVPDA